MAAYTYEKINWENEPSYNTPINETNLNHMDQAIFDLAYVKAEKEDAVFVNSISLERKAGTTVGHYSVAVGYDTEASGISSMAIGTNTSARNGQAFAGGYNSKALGNTSFAFGNNCITRFNSFESLAFGNNCIAGSANQMVFGKYNVEDTTGTYAEIVGNGSSGNESNARTLDWQGNETIAGDFTNGNGETLHGIYEALPVDTESGNPTVITDAFGGPCKSLELTLEPIQSGSGTPSPQNVRAINGRTQSVVTRTGKNLFDKTNNVINAYFNPSTPITEMAVARTAYIRCVPNTTYTVSKRAGASFGVAYTKTMPSANVAVYGATENLTATSITITTGADAMYLVAFVYNGNYDTITAEQMLESVQIEVGSTATPYEAYNGESITRTYGTTIYGGSDDVTGEGATSEWGDVTFDGSNDENWAKYGSGSASAFAMIISVPNGKADTIDDGNVKCDKLTSLSTSASWGSYDLWVSLYASQIVVGIQSVTTVEALRTWLSNNPLHVIYKLATPTSIPLTAQNITLLHGDNVLTTDADSIEASYSADIALYIEKKIAEGSQGNRSLSKGGASEEEPKEEEKKEEVEIKEEPLTKEVR